MGIIRTSRPLGSIHSHLCQSGPHLPSVWCRLHLTLTVRGSSVKSSISTISPANGCRGHRLVSNTLDVKVCLHLGTSPNVLDTFTRSLVVLSPAVHWHLNSKLLYGPHAPRGATAAKAKHELPRPRLRLNSRAVVLDGGGTRERIGKGLGCCSAW